MDDESLILVDGDDNAIGSAPKGACHDGDGVLHRAFSIFILNGAGELLLQRRSEGKRLWPGYWTNSCCSHPREGEPITSAVHRRLYQELGLRADLRFLYKFEYRAEYEDLGSEWELCSVFLGRTADRVAPDPDEIGEWRYVSTRGLADELELAPERYTPWFKLEWAMLMRDYSSSVARLASS